METMQLSCKLTEQELTERRDALASLVEKKTALEAQKKNAAAKYKQEIDEVEDAKSLVAYEIRTRSERREVAVTRHKDYAAGVEETIRTDTGEVVHTRVLDPHERQAELRLMRERDESAQESV